MSDICRNEEWLAAYLDKRLPEKERNLFEMHISRCPSCLAELIAAKAELDEMNTGDTGKRASRARFATPLRISADPRSRLRRVLKIASPLPLRRIRLAPHTAAFSLAVVLICAGAFLLLIRFTAPEREIESARENVSRILAATDIGHMRLSCGPESPVSHRVIYRGVEKRAGDAFSQTEKSLKAALEKRGNDWRPYAMLGDLYMSRNQVARAETFYEQALVRKPGDARLLNDRAVAAYRLGKFDLSQRNLESALAADSTLIEALYNLAVLYSETGDRANSMRHIELYLRKDPSSPWAERAKTFNGE